MRHLIQFIVILIWISGLVIAKGFWSVFFVFVSGGLWSFYLVVERILIVTGVI